MMIGRRLVQVTRGYASSAASSSEAAKPFNVMSFLNRVEAINKNGPPTQNNTRKAAQKVGNREHRDAQRQPRANNRSGQSKQFSRGDLQKQPQRGQRVASSKWSNQVNKFKSNASPTNVAATSQKTQRYSGADDYSSLMSSAATEEKVDLHLSKPQARQFVKRPAISSRGPRAKFTKGGNKGRHNSAKRGNPVRNVRSNNLNPTALSADAAIASLLNGGSNAFAVTPSSFEFAPQCLANLYTARIKTAAQQVAASELEASAAIDQCVKGLAANIAPFDAECVNSIALANTLNANPTISHETKVLISSLASGQTSLASLKA